MEEYRVLVVKEKSEFSASWAGTKAQGKEGIEHVSVRSGMNHCVA